MRINSQLPVYYTTQKAKVVAGFNYVIENLSSKVEDGQVEPTAIKRKLPPVDSPKEAMHRRPNINEKPLRVLRDPTQEEAEWLRARHDTGNMQYNSLEYMQMMNDLYNLGITSELPSEWPLGASDMTFDDDGNLCAWGSDEETIKQLDIAESDLGKWFKNIISTFAKKYIMTASSGSKTIDDKVFIDQYQTMQDISGLISKIF